MKNCRGASLIAILPILFFSCFTRAQSLELIDSALFTHNQIFEKTKIGGLSGLWFDEETSSLWAVSDDRGTVSEPRFYQLKVKVEKNKLSVEPTKTVFMKEGKLAPVLDMEAITVLPWGNFLIASEGDLNHKPRLAPQLLDVKKDGTVIREYEIPAAFLPEPTGEQKKGVRNNLAFEGLTTFAPKNLIWAWTEDSLVQDSAEGTPKCDRVLQYEMADAWVIRPTKQFCYCPDVATVPRGAALGAYVSEALAITESTFFVLERSLLVQPQGIGFGVQIYVADLKGATEISQLKSVKEATPMPKKLVVNFDDIKDKLGGKIENFEGMTWGPMVDGHRTVIVVSDNNFRKTERTQFLLFRYKEAGK